ncbi:type II toxin-antitoxin system ParD family antitoxin [Nostoc sp. CHAB 5844]|nr:type II toxin-antitoxin system ParD family antitoxin [Nostoc sp. CHAB 5844]
MSKTPFEKSQNSDDELLAEYKFDAQKAKPNRFVQETLSYQAWVDEIRILVDEGIASLEHSEGIDGDTFVNQLLTDLQEIKES